MTEGSMKANEWGSMKMLQLLMLRVPTYLNHCAQNVSEEASSPWQLTNQSPLTVSFQRVKQLVISSGLL